MLANRSFVRSYDQELRARLISNPHHAEYIIRMHLQRGAVESIHLPQSLTSDDKRTLIDKYLDSDDVSTNVINLIVSGRLVGEARIDAHLKLKAKRKNDVLKKKLFDGSAGIKTGSEVSISDTQTEPVAVSHDGLVAKFSYSRQWLEGGLDFPTILNNFLYLFKFSNHEMILRLPSYQEHMGVFERAIGIPVVDAYATGVAFDVQEYSSSLQTVMYNRFLEDKGVELESVISWFFADYLREEFGAARLHFSPSSKTATYLERSRNLFTEMESVVKQFSLYVENGELDPDLLAITSDQILYKQIPSLLVGKYVYANENQEIHKILHLLFSDQSELAYVNESLRARNGVLLLIEHQISYDEFHEYQKPIIDYLIGQGIVENTSGHVRLCSVNQVLILKSVFEVGAASYYHYQVGMRSSIDEMVGKGWLVRRQSLLTDQEGSYFNYLLNQHEFGNGPDLRNKYLHGSQGNANDDQHFGTYVTALKLLISLVIKINDDFWLSNRQQSTR
jgi:hypothetical protein